MRIPLVLILFFTLQSYRAQSHAALISTNAGRVGDDVVTTREVMLNHLVENILFKKNAKSQLSLERVRDREFVRETTGVLLENAIFQEAEGFSAATVSAQTIEQKTRAAKAALKNSPVWQKLQFDNAELARVVKVKLRARAFIKFKVDSATIPVSDREAEDYFNGNRLKFENLPFASFKANIKAYLQKQQVDRRLKDWFELLQSKFKVRNYLAE